MERRDDPAVNPSPTEGPIMGSIIPEDARVALEVELRDRLDRLESLTQEQRSEMLSRLAVYDSGTFDALLDEIANADGEVDPGDQRKAEAYCLLCGDVLAVFAECGAGWQHLRGDLNSGGPGEVYQADHEPFVAWRQSAGE